MNKKRYKTFILRTLVSNLLSSNLFFPYLPANVPNIQKLPVFLGLTLVGLCLCVCFKNLRTHLDPSIDMCLFASTVPFFHRAT